MTPPLRVIAAGPGPAGDALAAALAALGHPPAAVARTAAELDALCRADLPDLILVDAGLPGLPGPGAVASPGSPSVVLVADAAAAWATAVLPPSLPETALAAVVAMAARHAADGRALCRETDRLRQELANRKVIERAKKVVARRCGVSEADAYNRLRHVASTTNRKMVAVSEDVIASETIFHALDAAPAERHAGYRPSRPHSNIATGFATGGVGPKTARVHEDLDGT